MSINKNNKGFTILEIIISLVIVTVAITVFIKLLGNSTMIRTKVNDFDERVDVAIIKAEQTFLGLLGANNAQSDNKNTWQGIDIERGINWRIEEEKDTDIKGNDKNVYFYTVAVDGIEISSVSVK
jgi:prepilin-type N-terminal cleavage/methylation domain-containing protein